MSDGVTVLVRADPSRVDQEFIDLVERCYKEKPDKADLRELQARLDERPDLWDNVFDLNDAVQEVVMLDVITRPAAKKALRANLKTIRAGLGYADAPQVERLLIESIVTAWLRLQRAELQYSQHTNGDHSTREGDYWLQVLGAAQRRYLRAVETLARVRRITRATVQINVAEAGSHQVNIAGDLVK